MPEFGKWIEWDGDTDAVPSGAGQVRVRAQSRHQAEENTLIYCLECYNWEKTGSLGDIIEYRHVIDENAAFRAFLEGLEFRNIDDILTYSPERCRELTEGFTASVKARIG